jgi:hypothetical protein
MNLTHAYIPMGNGMYEILHNKEKKDTHVMDLRGPNYVSKHYHDMSPQVIECDPSKLPFMQKYSIEMFLPWIDKNKTTKYHGKEPGSIQILKKMRKMKKSSKIQSTQSLHTIRIHLALISMKELLC